MDQRKLKFIIKIGVAVIIGLIVLSRGCSSKAEGLMPSTPDPNASWDDYISANPIQTIPPLPTPEPTPEPTRGPMVFATQPYQDSYIRAYRLAPEVENGSTVLYYQKLTSPYSMVSSVPGQVAISRSSNQNWFEYTTDGASGGLPFQLTKTNSMINLVDNYICLQWNVNFSQSNTVGYGLDYGTTATFIFSWTMSAYVQSTNERINSLPVFVRVQTVLDNGIAFIDTYETNTSNLAYGYKFSIDSSINNRKIYSVRSYFYIGMTEEAYNNIDSALNRGVNDRVYYLLATGPQKMRVNVNTNPTWLFQERIYNTLSNMPSNILNGISNIFVPTNNQLTAWVNQHLSNQLESGSPINRYWELYLSLMNKFINPVYNPDPYLTMPAWSIDVNGTKYNIWSDFNFRIKNADIELPDGTTLFYWSKLVTSIIIVSNVVVNFMYAIFARVSHVSFASPAETEPSADQSFKGGGGSSRGGGVGRRN